MPNVVKTDIDNTSSKLEVTITKDEISPRVDSELKKFKNRVEIKGFRKGHTPLAVIKKMYGSSVLYDVFQDMMSQEVYDFLKDSKLNILGQPLPVEDQKQYDFNANSLEDEYTVTYEIGYTAEFDLKLPSESDSFERYAISDLDKLIDKDLEHAQTRMGEQVPVEDKIQDKDLVKIDATEVGGEYSNQFSFLINDMADEKLKKELQKKKKGDSVKFNARNLESGKDETHYRKHILNLADDDPREVGDEFEGTITEVIRVSPAEINEEFFKNYFGEGVTTIEEAREKLGEGISQFYGTRADALLMRDFQQFIMETNPVELPEKFLKRWLFVSNEGKVPQEEIDNQFDAFAENLRWTVLRENMTREFGIEVSQEEIRQEYERRVKSYFQNAAIPDELIASSVERLMTDEKDLNNTRETLETDKIFEALRELVSIKDKPIESDKLHQILDEMTQKAQAEQAEDAELRESVAE